MSWNLHRQGRLWLFSAAGISAAAFSLWYGATLNNTSANNTLITQPAASRGLVAQPAATFSGADVGAIPDATAGQCWGAFVPTPRNVTFNVSGVAGPPSNVELSTTFSPNHTWVGDVRATLIAPNGASHVVFGRTGATTSGASGDSSDLAGPYNFKDSAAGVNWWTEALNRLSTEALTAGNYRTTSGGGVGGAGTNTSMTPSFAGVANPTGTWTLRLEDGCAGDSGSISAATLTIEAAVPVRRPFDFDGDGKTDIGIFRPSGPASEWWINRSGTGQTFALQFGSATDLITPADYTGDGKTDIAFFRPSTGQWFVLRSEDFSFFAVPFGTNGDRPVPADYDADGKADFAVMRTSTSTWYVSQSGGGPTLIFGFGISGDLPVVADYDGDGRADVGIFRPTPREWWIQRSTAGLLAIQFGNAGDRAVQGDYTGDGKADVAIWRPSTGQWFIIRSEDFSFYGFPFGTTGDIPAPGDYDGDGMFDATVFRPSSSTWFIGRTTAGTQIVQFGATSDKPLPNAYVP